jgi:FkbM family methyltransferase
MPKLLERLGELLDVSRLPGGMRALHTSRPRSLASFKIVNDLRQSGLMFRTVIDGGANVGQFARACSVVFPGVRVLSFEPLPDVAGQLRENLSDVAGHRVFQTALGDRDGEVAFNRNAYSQSSSILDLRSECGAPLAGKQVVQQITVPLTRMDNALGEIELQPPVLLKLDLQGYELPALRGAPQTLEKCSHLLIETVFERAYQGEPLFVEIQAFLKTCGFRFRRPVNFLRGSKGQIVQMDALFERTETGKR